MKRRSREEGEVKEGRRGKEGRSGGRVEFKGAEREKRGKKEEKKVSVELDKDQR